MSIEHNECNIDIGNCYLDDQRGRCVLVVYFPILKGREGEMKAISNVDEALIPHIVPVFEVPPGNVRGPVQDAYAFIQRAQEAIPPNMTIAVDARHLSEPHEGIRRPLRDIASDLHGWGIPVLPVAHLDDTPDRLTDVGFAAALHGGQAIVRLGNDSADPDDKEAEAKLSYVLKGAGLRTENCALILDVFEIRSERDVTRVEPIVRKCISWAQQYPWQSIIVAAGAMPETISHLPTNIATPIRRWDLELWRRVQELAVDYGDYGIAHPGMAHGRWAPMPSLRYTDSDVWWTYRWAKDGNGNAPMYDLCKALTAADHWPPEGRGYSWGDGEIALRAIGNAGPGNATSWRAWGTSHHLAYVSAQTRGGRD
ncbi:beta family protein [Micromonospora chersina]|uniref:beta family protein n=1 Tax=Micromonospora chersina TaxID=47854 RepID=UPI0037101999